MRLLTAARAAALLAGMRGRRVVIVGDLMLDEFVWGHVSRISPEAPVPVVRVTGQSFHLGGAGNVAANVRALGGVACLAAVVGQDAAGERLRAALDAAQVDAELVVDRDGRPTTVKTRIVAHSQQVVRADREDPTEVRGRTERALLESVVRRMPGAGALVVSDYQKGVVTPRLLSRVIALARRRRVPVLVDPKVRRFRLYRGAALVTPNQLEAEQATGLRATRVDEMEAVGRRVLSLVRCRAALVTRGEHGMSLFERGRPTLHVPATAREVFDVTGAGDSVIATMALALGGGATMAEAAVLANAAAGVVVGKVGTAQASVDELLAAVRSAPRTRRRAGS